MLIHSFLVVLKNGERRSRFQKRRYLTDQSQLLEDFGGFMITTHSQLKAYPFIILLPDFCF